MIGSHRRAKLSPERRLAIWLLRHGYMTPMEIARALDTPQSTVNSWAQRAQLDWYKARQDYCAQQCKALIDSGRFDVAGSGAE